MCGLRRRRNPKATERCVSFLAHLVCSQTSAAAVLSKGCFTTTLRRAIVFVFRNSGTVGQMLARRLRPACKYITPIREADGSFWSEWKLSGNPFLETGTNYDAAGQFHSLSLC